MFSGLRQRKTVSKPSSSSPTTTAEEKKSDFDIHDATKVVYTRMGIWDVYTKKENSLWSRLPGTAGFDTLLSIKRDMQYVRRMVKDVFSIAVARSPLVVYLILELTLAFLPAMSTWYSGQLLQMVHAAVEHRTLDTSTLLPIAIGRITCSLLWDLAWQTSAWAQEKLECTIQQHYSIHLYKSIARLDLPTSEDPAVQNHFEKVWSERDNVAWATLEDCVTILKKVLQLLSQLLVLAGMLLGQRDGILLVVLSSLSPVAGFLTAQIKPWGSTAVWAATVDNEAFVRAKGFRKLLDKDSHRKEVVSGNLAPLLSKEYEKSLRDAGIEADELAPTWRRLAMTASNFSLPSLLGDTCRELPEVVFLLRAMPRPMDLPVSLTSFHLIQNSTAQIGGSVQYFSRKISFFAQRLRTLRTLYEIADISNTVVDGFASFEPTSPRSLAGITIEFRDVCFRYPASERYALRNVSFKLESGCLCVIVGSNGSGKSTILKLLLRLYDIESGQILINDQDIKNLKLADLRRAVSVLFQDFTNFPIQVKDNIGLGDPENFADENRILEAIKLGSAQEVIAQLPEGLNSYLSRPVRDHYRGLPPGTTKIFGKKVDYTTGLGGSSWAPGLESSAIPLSGGQSQRLALSRTFMRSLPGYGSEQAALLLFDEPSASLDPEAEHDLFERLRTLRGQKTMVFSSHRFGSLTRHADLILNIKDGTVVESGTHEQLLRTNGEYARLWTLQAKAFV